MKLPAPLSEPLGFLPPEFFYIFKFIAITFLVVLVAWILLKWYYLRKKPSQPYVHKNSTNSYGGYSYKGRLKKIKSETEESQDYRDGCFRLANLIKEYASSKLNKDVTHMSLHDFQKDFQGQEIEKFFTQITPLRFAKLEPKSHDFKRVAKLVKGCLKKGVRLK